jgi:tetratricopeptide (TPR) repeat protein
VLHLFRDTIDADALRYMGDPDIVGQDAVPQLAGLTRETAVALLDRAADIGLLSPLGAGYYAIHPALPWYFTTMHAATYGPPDADRAARAYTYTLAWLGNYYHNQHETGRADMVLSLEAEEGNLQHALTLALSAGLWNDATNCLQGLHVLYSRTGREGEWTRLVAQVTPAFVDTDTDAPLLGREDEWTIITGYRIQIAMDMMDWPGAARLQNLLIASHREQAAAALATPASQLTPDQRNQIRDLAVSVSLLANALSQRGDPGCLPYYEEALGLFRSIGARVEEARLALNLGNAFKDLPGLRDIDQAEHWYRHSLGHRTEHDRVGRAKTLWGLGMVAQERFEDARASDAAEAVFLEHLNKALAAYRQALDLIPADDAEDLAGVHNQLGIIYARAGDVRQALYHFQRSIAHHEARGGTYRAGLTRFNIAVLLRDDGRPGDALLYVRAALHDFERTGPGAARDAARARDLIADLEQETG